MTRNPQDGSQGLAFKHSRVAFISREMKQDLRMPTSFFKDAHKFIINK